MKQVVFGFQKGRRIPACWLLLSALAAGLVGAVDAAAPEIRGKRSEDGVTYWNERFPDVPWSVHIIQVERSRKDLGFFSAHARNKILGVSMLAEQARAVPKELGRAVASVNGDFYLRDNPTYAGDPRGLQIMNGDLISGPGTVCVWFDAQGNPHLDEVKGDFKAKLAGGREFTFGLNEPRQRANPVLYTPSYGVSTRAVGGRELILEKDGEGAWLPLRPNETYRARVRDIATNGNTRFTPDVMVLSFPPPLIGQLADLAAGSKVEISTTLDPSLKGSAAAIAGGPALIKDGKPFAVKNPPLSSLGNYSERSKYERHPRSAVGWSPTHVYFVTVDGRQSELSMGMKLAELAEVFVRLGCTDAMNLDGGKSAQMWLNGRIVNDPCQGEDTVANSLLVIRKADVK